MIVLRRTELQNLIGCEDAESEESEVANFGSLGHRCIELYFDVCMQKGGDVPEEIDSIVDAVLSERAWGVDPGRFTDLHKLMDRFVWSHSIGMDTFASTERKLAAEIETDAEDFILTGTVDRTDWLEVDGDGQPELVMITDYKTLWVVVDTEFQMNTYAKLICEMHPTIQEVILRPDFVRIRQDTELDRRMTRAEVEYWWDQTCPRALLGRVVSRYQAKERGDKMIPTGGSSCKYCAKRHRSCPAAVEPGKSTPSNEAQARELLGQVIRLEAGIKSRKDALKPWVAALGNLTTTEELDGKDVTKEYGPSTPKEKVTVTNPEKAVELGVATWTKPRIMLRKGQPEPAQEQGA